MAGLRGYSMRPERGVNEEVSDKSSQHMTVGEDISGSIRSTFTVHTVLSFGKAVGCMATT